MKPFGRRSSGSRAEKMLHDEAARHLRAFAAARSGVEMYVEPATTVTPATVLLVAGDGEWTRRRVVDERAGYDLARRLALPVYDAARVGYPRRMRDFNARRRDR